MIFDMRLPLQHTRTDVVLKKKIKSTIAIHMKLHTFQAGHSLGRIAHRYEKPVELFFVYHRSSTPSPFRIVHPFIKLAILDPGSVHRGVSGSLFPWLIVLLLVAIRIPTERRYSLPEGSQGGTSSISTVFK